MIKLIKKGEQIPEWANRVIKGSGRLVAGQTLIIYRKNGDLHCWGLGNGRYQVRLDGNNPNEITVIQGDPVGGGVFVWRGSVLGWFLWLPTRVLWRIKIFVWRHW